MSKVLQKIASSRPSLKNEDITTLTNDTTANKKRSRSAITPTMPVNESNKKVKLSANLRPLTATTKNTKGENEKNGNEGSNIIYLGHTPSGFFEKEMKKFFKQFGEVKRIKLFRSMRTFQSKGYAFVEFDTPETAKIVSETMNGYFLMERQLVSNIIPNSKVHEGMFLQSKKIIDYLKQRNRQKGQQTLDLEDEDSEDGEDHTDDEDDLEEQQQSKSKLAPAVVITEDNYYRYLKRNSEFLQEKQKRLTELGIDFQIPITKLEQFPQEFQEFIRKEQEAKIKEEKLAREKQRQEELEQKEKEAAASAAAAAATKEASNKKSAKKGVTETAAAPVEEVKEEKTVGKKRKGDTEAPVPAASTKTVSKKKEVTKQEEVVEEVVKKPAAKKAKKEEVVVPEPVPEPAPAPKKKGKKN